LTSTKADHRLQVQQTMAQWRIDPDLTGVRDAAALAKLAETERTNWQTFWEEVEALHKKAAANPSP
jgi:hypothetical protein